MKNDRIPSYATMEQLSQVESTTESEARERATTTATTTSTATAAADDVDNVVSRGLNVKSRSSPQISQLPSAQQHNEHDVEHHARLLRRTNKSAKNVKSRRLSQTRAISRAMLLKRVQTANGNLDLVGEALPGAAGVLMSEEVDRCCEVESCTRACEVWCGQKQMYTTVMLCLVNAFLFADQNLMAPNLTAIAREFDFSDLERDRKLGGDIALAFFVVGGVASLLVGYLADVVNRKVLFTAVVLFGESACLCTYWVTNYWQLFGLRAATGVSIGGAMPLLFSMIGDMYSTQSRGFASALAGLAMGFGVGLGQLVAGLVGPHYGWRLPFVLVALPALVIVLLYALTTSEPKRGGKERAIIDFHTARNKRRTASRASGGGDDDEVQGGATIIGGHRDGRYRVPLSDEIDEWGHFEVDSETGSGGIRNRRRRKSTKQAQSIELTTQNDSADVLVGGEGEVETGDEMVQSMSGAELFPSLSQSDTQISQLLGWADDLKGTRKEKQQQPSDILSESGSEVSVQAIATHEGGDYNIDFVDDVDKIGGKGRSDSILVSNITDDEIANSVTILYEERMNMKKIRTLLSSRSVLLIYLQGIPGSLPWGVMLAFFNDFLAQQKKVPVGSSTGILITFGLGGACGQIIGGIVGDKLYHINKRWVPIMMGTAALMGMLPMLCFIVYPPMSVAAYCGLSIPAGVLVSMPGSSIRALLLNVSLPECRGTAFAIFNLMDDLGKGLGPFLVSIIIQSTGSREQGLLLSVAGWALQAAFLFSIAFVIDVDVEKTESTLLENYLNTHGGNLYSDDDDDNGEGDDVLVKVLDDDDRMPAELTFPVRPVEGQMALDVV